MISILDNLKLAQYRQRLRTGKPVSAADIERMQALCAADGELSRRLMDQAVEVYRGRVHCGARLTSAQVEGLRMLDARLADQYIALRSQRSRAKSVADRVAEHVSRRSDIGEIPAVVNPERREVCRYDLEGFGVAYCGVLLKHAPSANMRPFIDAMQAAIIKGGRVHVRWPRGKGKSTWIKIGILWATLFGHRRFAVCFAANGRNAKALIGDIWKALERSGPMLEDFPEVAFPVRALKGVVQRCATQSYKGRATEIMKSTEMLTLPKIPGSVASGAMIVCRGVKSGTRGLVDMDQRPDFLFFDDIVSKKTAGSKAANDWLEEFVQDDAMCMAGHDMSIAALQASTPIRQNDVSERFADADRHPEWITFTTPLVLKWSEREDLVDEFGRMYRRDLANRDADLSMSRAFYAEHQIEIERGVEVLDPEDGDRRTELSAFHHALVLFFSMGRAGFEAEYQMKTRRTQEVFSLEPTVLCRQLNGYGRCVVADECRAVVAFCDVNAAADAGLRWEVMAFGAGRVGTTLAYGRYPATGRLYPENSTSTRIKVAVAKGAVAVAQLIAALPIRKQSGTSVQLTALCYDIGWETKAIVRAIKTMKMPFHVIGSRGFGWRKYQPYKPGGELRESVVGAVGDHCHLSESANGVFLAYHADYWREEAQRAFLAPPLQPGSCSLWGDDPTEHYDFVSEICNEKLADKGVGENGAEFWLWNKAGINHYGDTHTGCYVVASWYRVYDATEALIERAVREGANARKVARLTGRKGSSAARTPARKKRFKLVKKHG